MIRIGAILKEHCEQWNSLTFKVANHIGPDGGQANILEVDRKEVRMDFIYVQILITVIVVNKIICYECE